MYVFIILNKLTVMSCDFINCIDITDSVISDHRIIIMIITAKTLIPIFQFPLRGSPCQTMNYTCHTFEHYYMGVFLRNISQLLLRLYVIYYALDREASEARAHTSK